MRETKFFRGYILLAVLLLIANFVSVVAYNPYSQDISDGSNYYVGVIGYDSVFRVDYNNETYWFVGLPAGYNKYYFAVFSNNWTQITNSLLSTSYITRTGTLKLVNLGLIGYSEYQDSVYLVFATVHDYGAGLGTYSYPLIHVDIYQYNFTSNTVSLVKTLEDDFNGGSGSSGTYFPKDIFAVAGGKNGILAIRVYVYDTASNTGIYYKNWIYNALTDTILFNSGSFYYGATPFKLNSKAVLYDDRPDIVYNLALTQSGLKIWRINLTGGYINATTISDPFGNPSSFIKSFPTNLQSSSYYFYGYPVMAQSFLGLVNGVYKWRLLIPVKTGSFWSFDKAELSVSPDFTNVYVNWVSRETSNATYSGKGYYLALYLYGSSYNGTFRTDWTKNYSPFNSSQYYVMSEYSFNDTVFPIYTDLNLATFYIYEDYVDYTTGVFTNDTGFGSTSGQWTGTLTVTQTTTVIQNQTITVYQGVRIEGNGSIGTYTWTYTPSNPYNQTVSSSSDKLMDWVIALIIILAPALFLAQYGIGGVFLGLSIGVGIAIAGGMIPYYFAVLFALGIIAFLRSRE